MKVNGIWILKQSFYKGSLRYQNKLKQQPLKDSTMGEGEIERRFKTHNGGLGSKL